MKGKFIVFSGPDGCGKSTQTRLLKKFLEFKEFEVILTKEPSDGKIGKLLKEHYLKNDFPLIDALLFVADRSEHVKTEIKPNLEKGKIVISDRYYYSNLAYQHAQGLELEWLSQLNKFFPKPDIVFLIDAEPEICINRIKNRVGHRGVEKFEQLEFLKKIKTNLLRLAKTMKDENIKIIDGNKSIENVHSEILSDVKGII